MFVPHAAFANSPAISRFTRCTVPLPTLHHRCYPAGAQMLTDAASTFGDTLGRPSFFPCWRTRSRPARTLLRMIYRSCSPNTDAIWIMACPIGTQTGILIQCPPRGHHHRQRYCRPMRGDKTIPGHQPM